MRILALLLALSACVPCFGQTAIYRGRAYTPESYPQATWHTDPMCRNIQSQWRAQGWVSGYGRNKVMRTYQGPALPHHAQSSIIHAAPRSNPIYTEPQPAVQTTTTETTRANRFRTVTRYRQVTRQEPYQAQVCKFDRWGRKVGCTLVTRYRTVTVQEPYTVQEPIPTEVGVAAAQSVDGPLSMAGSQPSRSEFTSPEFARAVLAFINPNPSDVVYDLGCGDGELLLAAEPYGCTLIGIEIDKARSDKAQRRVPRATICNGDLFEQDYSDGNIFLAYLHGDMLEEVLPKLPKGATVVSLEHDVPGLVTFEQTVTINGQVHRFYVGVVSGR
jgi:hypothetical protein